MIQIQTKITFQLLQRGGAQVTVGSGENVKDGEEQNTVPPDSKSATRVSAAPEILWKPVFIRMTDFRGCLSPTDGVLIEHPLK